jgi:hypothetical protein
MATEALHIGPAALLVQNQVYALPARACYLQSVGTAPTVSVDGTTFVAVPAAGPLAYTFIRSTGTDTQVVLKTT